MTPEEIQQTIEGMLVVQRNIQEKQRRNTEAIQQLDIRLNRISQQQEINIQAIAL